MKRLLICLALAVSIHGATDAEIKRAADAIRPGAIAAHMRFLADDKLEGRGAGTRGYDLAAQYVAAMFESYGLAPAGDRGTYFQSLKLRQVVRDGNNSTIEITRDGKPVPFENNKDYLAGAQFTAEDVTVTAPLVFVGYGITAPEHGRDDYATIDAKGKIVVMFGDAPASMPSAVRAHYTGLEKTKNAVAHGAAGVIYGTSSADEKLFPWSQMLAYAAFPRMRAMRPDGTLIDVFPQLRGAGYVSHEGMKRLFAAAGRDVKQIEEDLKAGKSQSFDLPFQATIRGAGKHTTLDSANVAAILRGSDPRLRDEYVVYTAHLDHMGIGAPVDGDNIYNGAYDNASGIAALLEVARVFSEMPRPKRSILFLAVTAEERGLLGSNFFAQNPTVPIENIVANVNIDGVMMSYPPGNIVVLGADHSSLGPIANRAAAQLGMEVTPDPVPEQVFFVRSDQYSFVRQGVPAIAGFPGGKSSDPKVETEGVLTKWLSTIYHTPKDDLSQPFNFEAGATLARFYFLAGAYTAEAGERPAWNPGDFFGRVYARKK